MDDTAQAIQGLKELNRRINDGENAGSEDMLKPLLCTEAIDGQPAAPLLAFRRATGACVGASRFLQNLKTGGDRQIKIEDGGIQILGSHCALVTCVVTTGGKAYHNVRLFVRADPQGQDWKLLAWANEET